MGQQTFALLHLWQQVHQQKKQESRDGNFLTAQD